MKKHNCIFLTLLLSLFMLQGHTQTQSYNLFKLGIKGSFGLTDTNQLTTLTYYWIDQVAEASNAYITEETMDFPFNIEYGYQPFVIIRPVSFLQGGIKIDYLFSNIKGIVESQYSNEKYELNLKTHSYIPGAFVYLTFGNFEVGGGLLKSFSIIKVKDDYFGYNERWNGQNSGYELSLGFSTTAQSPIGFTMNVKYRNLKINEFTDQFDRHVIYPGTQEKMSLKMSGFFIEMGLYLQFAKIKKH